MPPTRKQKKKDKRQKTKAPTIPEPIVETYILESELKIFQSEIPQDRSTSSHLSFKNTAQSVMTTPSDYFPCASLILFQTSASTSANFVPALCIHDLAVPMKLSSSSGNMSLAPPPLPPLCKGRPGCEPPAGGLYRFA